MAKMHAYQAFDIRDLNLNRLIANQTDFDFADNVYATENGVTYQDVAYFQHDSGGYVGSYFGGTGITFNNDYSRVTGGTVTGFFEETWNGSTWRDSWLVQNFAYSAVTLGNAALTSSTTDDYAAFAAILGGNDSISLSPYADVVRGYGGNDLIKGNAGDDVLYGDAGADTLDGGSGSDSLVGGAGNDTYVVGTQGDKVYETTTINGSINAGGTDTVNASTSYTLGSYVEKLVLTGSSATSGTGNTQSNTVTGNSAANTLKGANGNDVLVGGSGADTLYGGAHNDLLRGGTGNDVLYGDSGNDVFRFDSKLSTATAKNMDRIEDFNPTQDTIQLENSIFTKFGTGTTGTIKSANFRANSTGKAQDSNDYLIYETDTGKLFYDANGSDSGGVVQIALLDSHLAMTHADFVLV